MRLDLEIIKKRKEGIFTQLRKEYETLLMDGSAPNLMMCSISTLKEWRPDITDDILQYMGIIQGQDIIVLSKGGITGLDVSNY